MASSTVSELWQESDTVIQGIVDAVALVNQTDQYDLYNVEVIVAEYLQDPVDTLHLIVRHSVNSSAENPVTFEKGERVILFLKVSNPYYTLVNQGGKFSFGNNGYENIYGETVNPPRGDTSGLVVAIGASLLFTVVATSLFWLKRRFTPVASQLM